MSAASDKPIVSLVISVWNRKDDLRENLAAIRQQTVPADQVIVVDNDSSDGTPEMVIEEFPEVQLIRMPHSDYGACETFNVGFSSAKGDLVGILDDDVILPATFVEHMVQKFAEEPETTAILSPKVVEPEMPDWYLESETLHQERYLATFRGCGSMARADAIRKAGWYDIRFFIFGNERDLTTRLLNLGYRVKMFPQVEVFHKAPFGMRHGKRSLYYHARNAWLTMIKYAPLGDLLRLPFLVVSKVLLRGSAKERAGEVSDATGTIGIGRSIRETPGAWLVLLRAAASVLRNLPYCLARRRPVRASDFELPLR